MQTGQNAPAGRGRNSNRVHFMPLLQSGGTRRRLEDRNAQDMNARASGLTWVKSPTGTSLSDDRTVERLVAEIIRDVAERGDDAGGHGALRHLDRRFDHRRVSSEFISSETGLGYLIFSYGGVGADNAMLAVVLFLATLGYLLDLLYLRGLRRLMSWHAFAH